VNAVRGRAFEIKVLNSLIFGLTHMPRVGFKLLLRSDNFRPVGIVTVKRTELDQGKGLYRTFAEGVELPGDGKKRKFFKEPLDRWNPAAQRFESVVLCENEHGIMITARRSQKIDDEDDENFIYFHNPLEVREIMKLKHEAERKEASIAGLVSEIESVKKERDYWKNEADALGSENRQLRDSVTRLSMELAIAKAQIQFLRRQAMAAEAFNIQIDAAFRKLLEDARERGVQLASSDVELALSALRKIKELREEASALTPSTPVGEEELKKITRKINELSGKLMELTRAPEGKKE